MGAYLTLRDRHERRLAAYREGVEALKPRLAAYGREHGGVFLLFGSAARGTPHDQSDVDIVVDFSGWAVSAACAYAEEQCWALGLTPDVRPRGWTSDKVHARALDEGLSLGRMP